MIAKTHDPKSSNAPASTARVAPTSPPILLREDAGNIAILTLNRPEARNSLSEALLAALGDAFTAFSAGHDLKELKSHRSDSDRGRAYFKYIMEMCSAAMQQIVNLPQPVAAAVQGVATAAGCQLVASCDLAVASSAAKFATPGVNIGLFCSTPMVPLSRNVARKHAMEMLLTGDMISAEDALRIGLVNRVVAPGIEREEALALGRKIAAKSAYTVKIGKKAFYRQLESGLKDAYRYATEVMVENMLARDVEEGIDAFLEKRAPKWEDR
jgi:enoyl-CoA hydratase/carnithine racemase